jgi:hypothetical protein
MDEHTKELLSKPTMSIDDAAILLGIGRNAAYDAARRGDIECITLKRRRRVITAPLRRMLGIEAA